MSGADVPACKVPFRGAKGDNRAHLSLRRQRCTKANHRKSHRDTPLYRLRLPNDKITVPKSEYKSQRWTTTICRISCGFPASCTDRP